MLVRLSGGSLHVFGIGIFLGRRGIQGAEGGHLGACDLLRCWKRDQMPQRNPGSGKLSQDVAGYVKKKKKRFVDLMEGCSVGVSGAFKNR